MYFHFRIFTVRIYFSLIVQNDRKYIINRKVFFSINTDLFSSRGMKIVAITTRALFIFIPLNENKSRIIENT